MNKRRIIFTADARFAVAKPEAGKPATLSGYAVVWNTLSSDRGGYKVRFAPDSATFAAPSLALFHHDYQAVLGNTANGTLRLSSDSTGVKVEIDLPDTQTARDVAALVQGGYVGGMSFAMTDVTDSAASKENGQEILEVKKFTLDEVTVTAIPAFEETSIGVKPKTPNAGYAARAAQRIQLERFKLDLYRLPGAEIPASAA
jgi:HK97 family phage prohead protease